MVVDAEGIPLGIARAGSIHLDRAYDSEGIRELLESRTLIGAISEKGKYAALKPECGGW